MMGASDQMMTTDLADLVRHHGIAQFLYREARLQDEHRFDEWEALWTDDALYWVPANGEDIDPERDIYGVPVEELRDAAGVLRWTAHLMEKTWAARSTWPLVIRHALTALEVPA